jgi:hypothetical protein
MGAEAVRLAEVMPGTIAALRIFNKHLLGKNA